MHTITTDLDRGIIEVEVEGFWDLDHLETFKAELKEAIRAAAIQGKRPATLYNYTRAAIQSQDVVAAMYAMAQDPALIGRRVALYTEGKLARMQAKRVSADRDNMLVFDSRAAALAWLDASRLR